MADFESAARRLAADQSRLRSRARSRAGAGGSALSARAKREAEQRRKREEERRRERERKKRRMEVASRYMTRCDRELGVVRSLQGGGGGGDEDGGDGAEEKPKVPSSGGLFGAPAATWSGAANTGLMLTPTSVHGDGDKIALPPSVLSALAERGMMEGGGGGGGAGGQQPLTFRVGVLRDGYAFPASAEMKDMMEKAPTSDESNHDADEDDDENDDMDVDEGAGNGSVCNGEANYSPTRTAPYLSELSRRYVAYTHGTVVEFTQDEGRVGLPAGIAAALLDVERQKRKGGGDGDDEMAAEVPSTRTVDPASASAEAAPAEAPEAAAGEIDGDDAAERGSGDGAAPASRDSAAMDEGSEERTPGHPAYGLFPVPSSPVEISLLRLPKGRRCKLVPTPASIRSGFYGLRDVKLVLEQSLIRTRATLSVGDVVHAWHRGTRFDLKVGGVLPAEWGAVSCVNTDIEVDIAAPEGGEGEGMESRTTAASIGGAAKKEEGEKGAFAPGHGRRLTDDAAAPAAAPSAAPAAPASRPLPPEPPASLREGVCAVQIRGDGVAGRRRFVVSSSTVGDLFAFASSLFDGGKAPAFRLVTRFPRRVFEREEEEGRGNNGRTMEEAGIGPGQEAFMVERI